MTAPLEDTPVTYEDLNDLNAEFDEVDTELRKQVRACFCTTLQAHSTDTNHSATRSSAKERSI